VLPFCGLVEAEVRLRGLSPELKWRRQWRKGKTALSARSMQKEKEEIKMAHVARARRWTGRGLRRCGKRRVQAACATVTWRELAGGPMRGCVADGWAMAGSDAVTLTRGPSATRWGAELTDGPGRIWKISNTIWTEFVKKFK
jgi:hypothetical protein